MSAAYLLGALAAAALFYAATAHQQFWPGARRHVGALRVAAWVASAVTAGSAVAAVGLWPGLFAALTAFMLACVLLPYADAWLQARRKTSAEQKHVG